MSQRSFGSVFRKLATVIAIIALVLFFLFLYYFKYVPDNRERLQHQGFLIMQQHEKGIQQKKADLANYFKTTYTLLTEENAGILKNIKLANKPSFDTIYTSPFRYTLSVTKQHNRSETGKRPNATRNKSPQIVVDPDNKDSIDFVFSDPIQKYAIKYSTSLNIFFNELLEKDQRDFFDSYMIICQQHAHAETTVNPGGPNQETNEDAHDDDKHHHIFYHSPSLQVAQQLSSDSAGKALSPVQFPRITDVEINANKYKAFLLPFQFEKNTFVLAGLMRGKEYNDRLQSMPFGTTSGIIILLILLLISLPYTKIFLISPEERFSIKDVFFLGTTLFFGTAVLLVIVQHIFMQTSARLRTEDELRQLNANINEDFQTEVRKACTELGRLDTSLNREILAKKIITKNQVEPHADQFFVKRQNTLLPKNPGKDSGYSLDAGKSYLRYTIVHWANTSGQQVFKGRPDTATFTLTDISYRKYFSAIKNDRLLSLSDGTRFSFQPVYSMSTNAFEVNIAIPSHCPPAKMVAMSVQMGSLINTILPQGFGFYLIDKDGLIISQSDGAVTLQENFLDWILNDKGVKQVINNRESRYIPSQYIFNRQYNLYVSPIDNLPFYLITYHDNNYTNASILRIGTFTLCSLLLLFFATSALCFIFWRKLNYCSRLRRPVFQYCWFRPGHENALFIKSSIIYLVGAFVLTAVYFWELVPRFDLQGSSIWTIALIGPVIALTTILLGFWQAGATRHWLEINHNDNSLLHHWLFRLMTDPITLATFLFLLLFSMTYYKYETSPESLWLTITFEVLAIALSFFYLFVIHKKEKVQDDKYSIRNYYLFWFLSVAILSLAPAQLFFHYAQRSEIATITKSQQLYLAQQTVDRLDSFDWFTKQLATRSITDTEKNEVLFQQGFYGLDQYPPVLSDWCDTCSENKFSPYNALIGSINWKSSFPERMFPVENRSEDRSWQWYAFNHLSNAEPELRYLIPPERKKSVDKTWKYLLIKSAAPGFFRYNRVNNFHGTSIILLIVILFMLGFYRLIRFATDNTFLIQQFSRIGSYGKSTGDSLVNENVIRMHSNNISNLMEDYANLENKGLNVETLTSIWDNEYGCEDSLGFKYFGNFAGERPVDRIEEMILINERYLKDLYEYLWKHCSEKERYFLYDMAEDGFMNYKNIPMIQRLFQLGLITKAEPGNLRLLSISFRNYLLSKKDTEEIVNLKHKYQVQGTWQKAHVPIQITIAVISTLLFITQQDFVTKILALVPNINALIGLSSTILSPRSVEKK